MEVIRTLKSNSNRLRELSKYSLWTLIAFLEKLLSSLDPPKNSTKCFMKLKFLPCSRITFIFSWLKYEGITKTLEWQVGWLSQKMALKSNGSMNVIWPPFGMTRCKIFHFCISSLIFIWILGKFIKFCGSPASLTEFKRRQSEGCLNLPLPPPQR